MDFQTQPGQQLYTLAGLASRSFVTEKTAPWGLCRDFWRDRRARATSLIAGAEVAYRLLFYGRSLFHHNPTGVAIWQHSNSRLTCFSVCRANTSRCPASG